MRIRKDLPEEHPKQGGAEYDREDNDPDQNILHPLLRLAGAVPTGPPPVPIRSNDTSGHANGNWVRLANSYRDLRVVTICRRHRGNSTTSEADMTESSRSEPGPDGHCANARPRGTASMRTTRTGTGGPALVFIHGFACDGTDWRAQVDSLETRTTVVVCELPGHGLTPGTPADCTIEAYGAGLARALTELELAPTIL